MSSIHEKIEKISEKMIRPYRQKYKTSDLGEPEFELSDKIFQRKDIILMNSRELRLKCSFFMQKVSVPLPCVIYLHSHTGSRLDSFFLLPVLLPCNINIFTMDMSGCGISDGEYLSLGLFEKEDINCAVNYLRSSNKVKSIGLWGKGMGAVASLLYAESDPSIGGMVIDSPFTSIKALVEEEIKKNFRIQRLIKSTAINTIRSTILQAAKFDINDLNCLEHVTNIHTPAIFCCSKNDDFASPYHCEELYEAYPGEKKLIIADGNHNSVGPQFFLDSAAIFFYNALQCYSIDLVSGSAEDNENSDDSYEFL